jgi:2-oxoglutarate dehydrogenase E2 component (dihydrolipoamide succinyltransferase)
VLKDFSTIVLYIMIIEIKIPSPGESISEVEIADWLVEDGSYVQKDQEIAEIESDKATLPLIAEKAGAVKILIEAGETAAVGVVACTIDTEADAPADLPEKKEEPKAEKSIPEAEQTATATSNSSEPVSGNSQTIKATPLARKLMEENNLNADDIINGLRKITKSDVENVLHQASVVQAVPGKERSREVSREKMSSLRRKVSERLVAVKNETAMLTTFNEVDMTAIMELRKKHQKSFIEKHGLKLGFMSFFTKACALALQSFPKINSQIEGNEIVTPEYIDIAIAVQTDKGLMVPVLRNVESLGIAETEIYIAEIAKKARAFRITPEEMSGGTFTITNGGVFGSLLSTPILNPPQSGILGMHNIVERPVALNGQVVIRPMMYTALSYDHRIVDGRESVSFLVKVKELLESPHKLLFEGADPEKTLLGL